MTSSWKINRKSREVPEDVPGREDGETPGDQESDCLQVETPVVSGY